MYEADYFAFEDEEPGYVEYGSVTLNLPAVDADGNGLPDISQKDRGVNALVSGNVRAESPQPIIGTVTGRLTRSANSTFGLASFEVESPIGSVSYDADWFAPHVSGSASYRRAPNELSFTLNSAQPDGSNRALTGSTSFTVTSADQVSVPQFTLIGSDGHGYVAKAFTLSRVGNRYIASLEILDGDPITSWPDYNHWVAEITDANDSNGNGIPDLSDTAPASPSIIEHPQSQTARTGGTVAFSVMAVGEPPLGYQWRAAARNIPGATSSTLVLVNVQLSDAATYTVVVSNSGGSVESQGATLIVEPELSIARSGDSILISWPAAAAGFQLESTGTLRPATSWQAETPITVGDQNFVAATPSSGQRFYRLRQP